MNAKPLPLTPKKAQDLSKWFSEKIKGAAPEGPIQYEEGQDGDLVIATQMYSRPGQKPFPMEIMLDRTAKGPRCYLTGTMIKSAFLGSYSPVDETSSKRAAWRAIRDGVRGERTKLTAMGFTGIFDPRPESKLIPWDAMVRFAQRVLDNPDNK